MNEVIYIRKQKNTPEKKSILERATEALDLPKDMVLHLPRLILNGHRELYIENFRGILEYGDNDLLIATPSKNVRVRGKVLNIKCIASEEITLEGDIESISFEGGA